MAKTDFSNLQGLKYPSLLLALANVEENYFITGWNVIKSEVLRISELAWKADLNGYEEKANKYYTSINIHFYLIHLNLAIVKEMSRLGISEITAELRAKYKLDCVEKNLNCLGVNTNTPLYKTWMDVQDTMTGEFTNCEFVIQEFTQTLGFNFNNCEELSTKQTVPVEVETEDGSDEVEVEVDSPVDRSPSNIEIYGSLYNGYTIETGTLAPTGWRVPSYSDCIKLFNYLGGRSVAGGKLKEIGTTHWDDPNWDDPNVDATDEVNFTALPGGRRKNKNGNFGGVGGFGNWWSSMETGTNLIYVWNIVRSNGDIYEFYGKKDLGLSIRCMRNLTASEEALADGTYLDPLVDIDGNEYKVVKIGTQVWMAENLKVTRYNNGVEIPNIRNNTEWSNLTTGAYCSYNNE